MQGWGRKANLILRHGDWLFLSAMATAILLLCARFVHMEHAFYYWDLSFYEEETYTTALAFSHSPKLAFIICGIGLLHFPEKNVSKRMEEK
jgi:hypothetical protein